MAAWLRASVWLFWNHARAGRLLCRLLGHWRPMMLPLEFCEEDSACGCGTFHEYRGCSRCGVGMPWIKAKNQ